MPNPNLIVDGHLDLAFNALFDGRDLEHKSALEIRALEADKTFDPEHDPGLCMATLPEMHGRVALAFATLFALPRDTWTSPGRPNPQGYTSPAEAQAQALAQLEVYEGWQARGRVRLIASRTDLAHHLELWPEDGKTGLVILMEGADPIVAVSDLQKWWDRGVRIIGTSWGATRYAGGTEAPSGLTELGREFVPAMQAMGFTLDVSHQSWEAFDDSIAVGAQRVIASHSNCFALTPTSNRHLSDEMIRQIGARGGVIGTVLFNRFLEPSWTREDRRTPVTLTRQVRAHMTHVAKLIGWEHVGIGSDIDGGLGRDETPQELETIADLGRIAEVLPDAAKAGVLGGNWLRFLEQHLP